MAGSNEPAIEVCPNQQTLQAVINLPPQSTLAVNLREHLAQCANCQRILDEITDHPQLNRLLGSIDRQTKTEQRDSLDWLVKRIAQSIDTDLESENPSALPAVFARKPDRVGQGAAVLVDTTQEHFASLPTISEKGDKDPLNAGAVSVPLPATIGRFSVLKRLGQGGHGIVYLAYDPQANRNVALKVMSNLDEAHQQRLRREAQAIARLQCDHVIRLYAVETASDGQLFLVMEYIEGPTLAAWIAQHNTLSPEQLIDILVGVARGLQVAHDAGILHRDVKPGNVLLGRELRPKLADFGLARFTDTNPSLTDSGMVVGTLAYLSPETVAGKSVDARSDVYSLGCLLYEAATGTGPFHGAPQQILRQIAETDPLPIRQLNRAIPVELETICLKAMAKEPGLRYASPAEFAADLLRFQRGEPILAQPMSTLKRAYKWVRRNRWPAAAMAATAMACIILLVSAALMWQANRAARGFNATLQAQNEQLVRSRQEADRSFELTRTNLATLVERLKTELLQIPHAEPIAIESIRDAANLYRRLTELRPNDQQVAEEYLQALKDLWYAEWLFADDSQEQKALEVYQSASIRLRERFPQSVAIGALRADLLLDLAEQSRDANEVGMAQSQAQEARALLQTLAKEDRTTLSLQQVVWKAAYQDYLTAIQEQQSAQAIVELAQQMVNAQKRVVSLAPPEEQMQSVCILVDQISRLAESQLDAGLLTAAEESLGEGLTVLQPSLNRSPLPMDVLLAENRLTRMMFRLRKTAGQLDEAASEINQLVQRWRRIVADYPEGELAYRGLAESLLELADFEWKRGNRADLPQYHEEIRQLIDRMERIPSAATTAVDALKQRFEILEQRLPPDSPSGK